MNAKSKERTRALIERWHAWKRWATETAQTIPGDWASREPPPKKEQQT